ncbi:MFS transporter [Brevibacillus fulvus]|uniref:MFS-type drug efflux transporter P55 n=1 Tax=Brevibacillus fulvus TaxID=1125967 RepID=A0A939BW55_9BACL|nr:MFS transporter [Brevibacillus fulvus]MBM7591451.1 EmrB/QacA subfamily drug resistance transporter [Brevibacillus fulvus]
MNARISIMASIVLAMLVSSMDTTIINTTMPIISKELGGFELYAWSFASYMIVSTVVSPIAGRISDIFGRKKVFGLGLILFLIGSFLCGYSNTMLQLVIFRAVQGVGAGILMPFPAIIAGDLFSVSQRGKIQALFSAMWGLSAILAPLLGSVFVEVLSWRWIFYINIPICIISLLLLMPYKEVYEPKKSAIDYLGTVLFAIGVSLILLTTVVSSQQVLYAVLGIIFLLLFFVYERRHPAPIMPMRLFHNRAVAWMLANSFLSCVALFGTSSYVPLFLQQEGYSTFVSGVSLLGSSIGWMSVAVPAGKWILRYGYRPLIILANVLLVLSGIILFFLDEGKGFWYVFVVMIVQGMAFGLLTTVTTIGSQQLVDPHLKGISTSLQMFARNIGTAIGVIIMGVFFTKAADFFVGIHSLFLYGLIASLVAFASSFFIRETTGAEADQT